MSWWSRLFGRGDEPPELEWSEEEIERYNEAKRAALEQVLGRMHETVGHAVIPFFLGGGLDLYYFPNCLPGTAFATMELIAPDASGPRPNRIGTYELVAVTRHAFPSKEERADEAHPFNLIEQRIAAILTTIGHYSTETVLRPGETCEIPGEANIPPAFLVLDQYDPNGTGFVIEGRKHCLLLCIAVFQSEMQYAIGHGGASLLARLKDAGHYPYSDLDRAPVI